MGIAERKEREKKQMRELILLHAMQLFVQEGVGNVSIRKIAERIEYSPATIYLYFSDKDAIFHQLHIDGFTMLVDRMKVVRELEDPLHRLEKLGNIYIDFGLEHPEYYELMFILRSPMKNVEKEWSPGESAYGVLRETVELCLEQGKIPAGHLEAATIAIWSTVHGFVSLAIRERLKLVPDQSRQAVIQAVKQYISTMFHQ